MGGLEKKTERGEGGWVRERDGDGEKREGGHTGRIKIRRGEG